MYVIEQENSDISNEYYKKLNQARILTVSRMDVAIIKDCEAFVQEMVKPDEFDGSMLFAMKTVLSYYEVKKDRVLTDYLFLIAIPLIYAFGNVTHLLKLPSDLIGYYFTMQLVVQFYDPYVDLIIKHDEAYDSQMTDLFMNSLGVIDKVILYSILLGTNR